MNTLSRILASDGSATDPYAVTKGLQAIASIEAPRAAESLPPAETTVAGIGETALTGLEETATETTEPGVEVTAVETTEPTETTKVTPIPELPLITGEAALEQRRRQIFKDNGIPKAPDAGRRRR